MPIQINDRGSRNKISIDSETAQRCSGYINFSGNDNHVIVGSGSSAYEFGMDIGSDCLIDIGEGVLLARLVIYAKAGSVIAIGNNTGFTNRAVLHAAERFDIRIGSNCIIADDFLATVSDLHSIVDVQTGKRLNYGKSILVEDRVWLAASVKLMKGTVVGEGSIVSIGSVVTGIIPPRCIAAGVPAVVKKTGVTWDYNLIA